MNNLDLLINYRPFHQFLINNQIDVELYSKELNVRYIRLRNNYHNHLNGSASPHSRDLTNSPLTPTQLASLKHSLGLENSAPLTHIPPTNFFSLPSNFPLSQNPAYIKGDIQALCLSSGLAVYALDIQPTDHVLDLCCAPGAKLIMMSDMIKTYNFSAYTNLKGNENKLFEMQSMTGSITGVDISTQRLSVCRSLVKKFKVMDRVRLFCSDAKEFNIAIPNSILGLKQKTHDSEKNDIVNAEGKIAQKPFYAPKHLRSNLSCVSEAESSYTSSLYDRVLVDAECSHDGSIAHLAKYVTDSSPLFSKENFTQNYLSSDILNKLSENQLAMLKNGYRLLKPGGRLVYATCSFSRRQNEEIIIRFLLGIPKQVRPKVIDLTGILPYGIGWRRGHTIDLNEVDEEEKNLIDHWLKHMIRLDPVVSNTSGLFIVALEKPKNR